MQSFGCVLKRRCTERCTFSENLPEGWNGGTALEKKQEDGRFCRAYLRTMDPEQAAAEIGRRDGYAMLGQKGTQQKLERMRCDAAAQLKREDVLRQLARLAFGRVDDAVQLALRRGEPYLVSGDEALKIWVTRALRPESQRFRYTAWSADYGNELTLLLGGCVDQGILESQVRQYVRDALLACPYIREVDGFSFSKKGSRVEARFTVHTVYEEFTQKTEVSIR